MILLQEQTITEGIKLKVEEAIEKDQREKEE